VLTQQYAMSLPFTVAEVVQMGRYPHTSQKLSPVDRDIVAGCLRAMQAEKLSSRLFHTLSGGEQQRVQMARVLAQLEEPRTTSQTKFLLLDEPTASMDWLHQQLTLGKAKEMASRGYMVIVVLHDLNLAAQYADRLILLQHGRLLSMGKPREIIEPALIEEAYGIQVSVLHPDSCDFPVIVPVKNIPIKHPIL
jgi:iron complex transport system ATP-binding protein